MKAFPQIITEYDESSHEYTNNVHSVGGMDLRDYFAAKVIQGIYSTFSGGESAPHFNAIAADAYIQADAMMKARGN